MIVDSYREPYGPVSYYPSGIVITHAICPYDPCDPSTELTAFIFRLTLGRATSLFNLVSPDLFSTHQRSLEFFHLHYCTPYDPCNHL